MFLLSTLFFFSGIWNSYADIYSNGTMKITSKDLIFSCNDICFSSMNGTYKFINEYYGGYLFKNIENVAEIYLEDLLDYIDNRGDIRINGTYQTDDGDFGVFTVKYEN